MNLQQEERKAYIIGHPFESGLIRPAPVSGIICPFCGSGSGKNGTGATVYIDGRRAGKLTGTETGERITFTCYAGECITHSGKNSGDIFDIIGKTYGLNKPAEIYSKACEIYGLMDPPAAGRSGSATIGSAATGRRGSGAKDAPEIAREEPPADYADFYREAAAGLLKTDYWKQRGISEETARRFNLGYVEAWKHPNAPETVPASPRLIIPISATTYTARDTRDNLTDAQADYKKQKAGRGTWIFNAGALQTASAPIFVTEGEIDAISICEAGGEAVATGSASYINAFLETLEQHRPAQPLVIAMDNDRPGEIAAQRIVDGLDGLQIPFYRCNLYGESKDANEALVKDRAALSAAIAEAEEMAKREADPAARAMAAFLKEAQGETYKPIPTGIKDIDRALSGGFFRGTLVLFGAAPGMGKTAIAQQIFEQMAAAGQSVLFLNLEMSRAQLMARSISRRIWKNEKKDVSALDVLQGYRWTDEQRAVITEAAREYQDEIMGNLIYNPGQIAADLNSILQAMENAAGAARSQGKAAPFVCIDYLQLIQGKEREDSADTIKRAVKAFKDYAMKNQTTVFVIMAQNRESNKAGISDINSGRDTSAIEYSGDILMGLAYTAIDERQKDAEGNLYTLERIQEEIRRAYEAGGRLPEVCNNITLKINKNRFGENNRRAKLLFDGRHGIFNQLEKKDEWKPAKKTPFDGVDLTKIPRV